ncbi:MAG: helix-turn-helix transcriptional regulator [Clostridiales bacterium]
MSEIDLIVQNLQHEMKRGILVLVVITQLENLQYGYSLIQDLKMKGFVIEQNTLYPLLRRIEKQGLLESVWQIENNRTRRYYKTSKLGLEVKEKLTKDWNVMIKTLSNILGGKND